MNDFLDRCSVEEETDPEYVVEVALGGSDSADFLDDDDMSDDDDSDEETEVRINFLSNGEFCTCNTS